MDHQGTEDLIRVPISNGYGLGPDYSGGLSAELVAPVSMYAGTEGDAVFLDALDETWMRTWAKE